MTDQDYTLTSPLLNPHADARPLMAVTIVWHPQQARIGEQYVAAEADSDIELSRYAPLFWRPDGDGLPLDHVGISRHPLRLARDAADNVVLTLPASRMLVELNGQPIEQPVRLDAKQIAQGQVLTLGRAIVLCVHWMNRLPAAHAMPGMVGVGSAAIAVREQIALVAPTDMPVLLLGETGTGKEIAARAIHALSRRRNTRLVTVNMAALNESLAMADLFGAAKGAYTGAQAERQGWFGEGDGATIFLDEIGNAPASVQPMLLRVLEGGDYRPLGAARDRQATARLIAATDQQLDGTDFNQALLRRLEGFVIALPALRTRREDIGVLIVHVLESQVWRGALPVDFVTSLACHDWPGNIRQLVHIVKRAALQLQADPNADLRRLIPAPSSVGTAPPPGAPSPPSPPVRKKPSDLNDQDVLNAMMRHAWTIQAAAQALGISRPSLYKLLERHAEIRPAHAIPVDELKVALAACEGDLTRCAAMLKTPVEPLRRQVYQLRQQGGIG
ncbi:sigma-54-dependent Fis family transcriptional regulator [Duganella sp. BJB488]|uniref:sigma 54-interacting transcriptional regulator n=1 Tax=unclassified Duganella TaxID=2636909 RepID=UPI000E355165|nr:MULTISPECIES: sigma 54-interacting transcriptional regulator [unclassified Duganella]RFP17535.1 sigma-54-dependent Fis family transcriptional regulator [Duganella sp. BJB489]RFP22046.1 sigma-54-dependent Fis family transcriptional regulator [Duganella sp. BJB488]RFP37379.1 sigma-54-dependent Fis family transcriptional regulator [Duganella sp. BJB480]